MQPPADAHLRERYVELDEARVRLLERDGNSDRTVLFLHGVTSSAATWTPFLERLPDGIRGVAYDALGCGYTERHCSRRRPRFSPRC